MSSEPTKFTIDGRDFVLNPLKLKDQMTGWSIVGSVLVPIFASGAGTISAEALQAALKGMDRVFELYEMFANAAKTQWEQNGMVSVRTFGDNIFARRSDLLVAFVAECVFAEYGSFLGERGKGVLSSLVDRFDSLSA